MLGKLREFGFLGQKAIYAPFAGSPLIIAPCYSHGKAHLMAYQFPCEVISSTKFRRISL